MKTVVKSLYYHSFLIYVLLAASIVKWAYFGMNTGYFGEVTGYDAVIIGLICYGCIFWRLWFPIIVWQIVFTIYNKTHLEYKEISFRQLIKDYRFYLSLIISVAIFALVVANYP